MGSRKILQPILLVCWLLIVAFRTQAIPAAVIDDCSYASDAPAQAAWKAMEKTPPVLITNLDGVQALMMRCNYATNPGERAYWDQSVKLNLTDCEGFEFKVYCRDSLPVEYFTIYFQSGAGWYHADFYPESSGGWNRIHIEKSAMKSEGQPAGWDQVKTIRVAAWRGLPTDTEFYVSGLRRTGGLGGGASVIVLKSQESARQWPAQAASFERTAKTTAQTLQTAGIAAVTINDDELTGDELALAKLVVLPQDPALPDRTVNLLADYAKHGGKFLVFYTMPSGLRVSLGLESGGQVKAPHAGAFAKIQFEADTLPGAPQAVLQNSENIGAWHSAPGVGRVLANWLDSDGKPSGYPAVIATSNYIVMTHVLLPGDDANKAVMIMAMANSLVPELGQQSVEAALARAGQIASFTNFDDAFTQIKAQNAGDAAAAKFLDSAGTLRDAARQLAAESKYAEAGKKVSAAGEQLKQAFFHAQRPEPGEFRAFWCHSAWGVPGMSWDEAIHRLAENGFTAIIPNMLSAGVAYYPSKVLPVADAVAERGDQISQCLAACRKYGIQMYVWKLDWNLNGAPKSFVDEMRSQHRLQISDKGKEELWLCPSHPDNRQLEIAALLEVVSNYDVDGIHFDYIRYPGPEYCFCDGCKARFQQGKGVTVQSWPADVLPGGPLRQQWLDWRRNNITTVVKAVNDQARALKPKIKLSAAVFRYWNVDRDLVGQDWKLWCEKGYLDFLCPMDYTPSKLRFENMVSQQVQWAGKVPCYPGLGASSSSSHFGADRAIEEIAVARRYHTGGFVIFNYGSSETKELLPELGAGMTRP